MLDSDDSDDYPTAEELARVREWPWQDSPRLFEFIKGIWYMPDWGWREEETKDITGQPARGFKISTAGWSGNESLIEALEANHMAWALTWVSSRRGGHYEFEIPRALVKP
jgi:hypothetical protein